MYTLQPRAIKKIMFQELEDFYHIGIQAIRDVTTANVPKEMFHDRYSQLRQQLYKCESYEDLEKYCSDAGYKMSLVQWVESL